MCSDYVLLREHFKKAHILCEEGECRDAEFTNVFRSDIDYRAHWAQKHSAGVGRQQARQMRQIDISVDFGDSAGDSRGGRGYHQRGLFAPILHTFGLCLTDVLIRNNRGDTHSRILYQKLVQISCVKNLMQVLVHASFLYKKLAQ